MEIREAIENDIPSIVQVLKASLGETDLPLSEEIWKYKHENNPFGKSIVLVAEEGEEIVGIRALMRWKWQKNNELFSALRAVDTATHPNFQGKGIFKKLTLSALEIAKKNDDNFVFNTPNDQSRPGYLKMDWKIVGKVNVALKPAFHSFWKFANAAHSYNRTIKLSDIEIEKICESWNKKLSQQGKLFTPKSREQLLWRYEENPLQGYEVIAKDNFYLAAYIKKRKGIKELRISECIYNHEEGRVGIIKKNLKLLCSKFNIQIVSYSPSLIDLGNFVYKGSIGPILTLRELNLIKETHKEIMSIETWCNSLGDLELF